MQWRTKYNFWRRHTRWWKRLAVLLVVLALAVLLILELASRGAAAIFNHAMERQDMLRGTIQVERMIGHVNGHVYFDNLSWQDEEGNTLLLVPHGELRVNLWDILTQNLNSTTITELTLDDAEVSLHFADDMSVDFIKHTPSVKKIKDEKDWWEKVSFASLTEEQRKRIGELKRKRQKEKVAKNWSNFNRAGRKIRLKLNLNHFNMELFVKGRHYVLSNVDVHTYINTDRQMSIDARTGMFGGTMIGQGVSLSGTVDFPKEAIPVADLSLQLYDVDPSSLGFGMNIHDKMTLKTHITGPVDAPVGEGVLQIPELHIPGLSFSNVTGTVHYEGSKLLFSDVQAKVYDGQLVAEGDYDLDTRYYHLRGRGTNLSTSAALPDAHLKCRVDLDIDIDSKGSPKDTVTSGSFVSGPGRYRLLPFERLAGRVTDADKNLHFYDVAIDLAGVRIRTDAFHILHGKLQLNPIQIFDGEGNFLTTYTPDK